MQSKEGDNTVSTFSKMPWRLNPVCGVHAAGRDDYMGATAGARLRAEEAKLQRRIESHCRPMDLLGYISIFVRRRRLLRKLRGCLKNSRMAGIDLQAVRKNELRMSEIHGWISQHFMGSVIHNLFSGPLRSEAPTFFKIAS